MSPQRVLDAVIIVCVGTLIAAFILDDINLAMGAGVIGAAAVILDDIIRN